jgi:hypothetical protein
MTAVEWLIDMLVTENEVTLKGENYKLFNQAKEMHRKEMENSYNQGLQSNFQDFEQWYSETFKPE